MVRVLKVTLDRFRGMKGSVELGEGLTLILGPNNSGKTAILEAILHSIILNIGDIPENISFIQLSHDARGSPKHSIISIIPGDSNEARACVTLDSGEYCVEFSKSEKLVTKGHSMFETIFEITMRALKRNCSIKLSIGKLEILTGLEGNECTGTPVIGILTPGIIPYNFTDTYLGHIKAKNPKVLEDIRLTIDGKTVSVDLAADPWGELAAILVEEGRPTYFYSVGRGAQRVIEVMLLLRLRDIILIDEVESSLHPELLAQVASEISVAIDQGKQVIATTQSIEAATMVVSTRLFGRPVGEPSALLDLLQENGCPEERARKLNVLIVRRSGERLRGLLYRGCDAVWELAGSRDARLAYRIIKGG